MHPAGSLLKVVLSKREKTLVAMYKTAVNNTIVSFDLPPTSLMDGVLRVTVYESDTGLPLAERCVSTVIPSL